MTTSISETVPISFYAGDLVQWTQSFSDYSAADSYVLMYYLVLASAKIDLTGTAAANGTDHLIDLSAVTTAAYAAGKYSYIARIEKSTEIYTVDTGMIEIKTDFATQSSGYDARTHAETCLDNIETVLEGKATADNYSYSIAGRSLSKYSWDELTKMRDYYKAEVLKLDRKRGRVRGQLIKAQF